MLIIRCLYCSIFGFWQSGQQITEAKYINEEGFNIFVDGKALTQLNKPDTCKVYIDHYGNIIEHYYEDESLFPNYEQMVSKTIT